MFHFFSLLITTLQYKSQDGQMYESIFKLTAEQIFEYKAFWTTKRIKNTCYYI